MSPLLFSPRFALHALYANAENAAVVVSHLHSVFLTDGKTMEELFLVFRTLLVWDATTLAKFGQVYSRCFICDWICFLSNHIS